MTRQEDRRTATRGAILAAATGSFGSDGFARTTIDAIAARAGVAKGAVFHHFPSKEALFEAVLESCAAGIGVALAEAARGAPDPLAAMDRGTRAYFRTCSDPRIAQIMLKDGPAVLGWARWREIDERHFGYQLPIALGAAMDAGLIARQPVLPLTRVILGALTEAAVACSESDDPARAAVEYADAVHLLIGGLRRDHDAASTPNNSEK
jgi:AcrR family transcriptional regulator